MYIVKIKNGNITTEIHGFKEKLISGSIVKGINTIDSFSFSILPSNVGFNLINDLQTLVTVYNTNKNRYEYYGRVLYSSSSMDEAGCISKKVICESYLGFLCDSQQKYIAEQNWTVSGLLQHIMDEHNSQVEEYKQFTIGVVNVEDANDNLYLGIQRQDTWNTLKAKLIDRLGGEFRFRVANGVTYLDYLTEIGETKGTAIQFSRNMKAITRECNPSNFISRLIPLGAKLKDAAGNETEERLDITSVNDGLDYIEDEAAKAAYGIRVESVEFDDVTVAENLLAKGKAYLKENNRVKIKYSIRALDLSLLGLDIDDFDVCNYHPIKNSLLGIDDTARIIKKNINICNDTESTIEVGDNLKTLSDLQREQTLSYQTVLQNIKTDASSLKNTVTATQQSVVSLQKETKNIQEAITIIQRNAGKVSVINKDADGTLTTVIDTESWAAKYVNADGVEISGLYFDFDNAQFVFNGSGHFTGSIDVNSKFIVDENGNARIYGGRYYAMDEEGNISSFTSMDKDGFTVYSADTIPVIKIGFPSGNTSYPYVRLLSGETTDEQCGIMKKFANGLWLGNDAPADATGEFVPKDGYNGFFVSFVDGKTYVVNGTDMQNVYTGESIARFG